MLTGITLAALYQLCTSQVFWDRNFPYHYCTNFGASALWTATDNSGDTEREIDFCCSAK